MSVSPIALSVGHFWSKHAHRSVFMGSSLQVVSLDAENPGRRRGSVIRKHKQKIKYLHEKALRVTTDGKRK
jgi:hypothetical protein